MKHLLTGVAIAAALAIAVPTWAQAQAPTTSPDMGGKKASGGAGRSVGRATAAPAAAPAPAAPMQMHHRPMRNVAHHHGHAARMSAGDATTDQLNREELARIQGGGAPAAPPAGMRMMPEGGPRPSGH
jgi:hypothetical protein